MNGTCNSTLFWTCPLESLEGVKRSNIIKFQLQSQFQRFLNQTLYVLSHIKDIKHIRDFHAFSLLGHAPLVGLGGAGGARVRMYGLLTGKGCAAAFFFGPYPLGSKGHVSLNFNYKVNFKALYVFLQIKDIKHIKWGFQNVLLERVQL